MIATKNSQLTMPFVYNFRNWELFYEEVMEYHRATFKNDRRVIDFIKTFRQFMSCEVLEQLDTLVNLHPRFDTMYGLNDWVNAVMALLHQYDPTLGLFLDIETVPPMKLCSSSAYNEWGSLLKNWSELDKSVAEGVLASDTQRQRLWLHATAEQRSTLTDMCEFFDPENHIWRYSENNELKWAEQRMCYTMASISSYLTILRYRQIKFWKRWLYTFIFLSISSVVMELATRAAKSYSTSLLLVFLVINLALSVLSGARYRALKIQYKEQFYMHEDRTIFKS